MKYVGRLEERTRCKFCGLPIAWIHREGRWLPRNRDATQHTCLEFFDQPDSRNGPVTTRPASTDELARFH